MARREEPIPALSAGLSHVVLTGLFLAAAFASPERTKPGSVPSAQPVRMAAPLPSVSQPQLAMPPPASPPVAEGVATVEAWPAEDVARGKEQCMHLLSSTAAEIEWLDPVKKGSCGLPAPVRLKSVGSGEHKVLFDPPVNVNCRMVVALGNWVKASVQPKAQERFKSRVARVVRASGYSCRNIYNRPDARLSQHALANAIDIGGFKLADGRTVGVLNGWGLTQRDIMAREKAAAAAKAKAKAKAAKGKGSVDAKAAEASSKSDQQKASGKAALMEQAGKNLTRASLSPSSLGKQAVEGAGAGKEAAAPEKPTREAQFLRDIHLGACKQFGTVLGPEANDPHRNHFHLDLIARRGAGYCQ